MPATAVHQLIGPEINTKYYAAVFPPFVGMSAPWQDSEAAALYRMPATKAEHSKGMVRSGMPLRLNSWVRSHGCDRRGQASVSSLIAGCMNRLQT